MTTATYTQARNNFKKYCDMACDNSDAVIITRERGENVVLISETEWEAIEETLYIMSDPNRMARLRKSLDQLEQGKTIKASSIQDLHKKALEHA